MASAGKILIIVQNLPVPFDRRVWLEAVTLKERNYRISVVCPKGMGFTKTFEEIDGISIYRYPWYEARSHPLSFAFEFAYCWMMTAILSVAVFFREGFQVIHACNPPDTFFLLALIYRPFGIKFVFDQHDLCPEMYLSNNRVSEGRGIIYRSLLVLERLTYASAEIVLATNKSYKEVATKRGRLDEECVTVVRTGPDFNRLKIVPPDELLKKGKRFLICYLGSMGSHDGVDYLIRSFRTLVTDLRFKDAHLALIGGGTHVSELKALVKTFALQEYVTFTGRISDEEVNLYLSTADLCASPDPKDSFNDKSTMNKTLEYMAMAKPIVAFDLKETRFSARDAARYAHPNDERDFSEQMKALLLDPLERERMGRFGRVRIENELSWEHTRHALLKAYSGLIQKSYT